MSGHGVRTPAAPPLRRSPDDRPRDLPAPDLTTADVIAQLRCSRQKLYKEAKRHGIGYNLGGGAGYRFTAADVDRLREALKPAPAPVRTRRPRRRTS